MDAPLPVFWVRSGTTNRKIPFKLDLDDLSTFTVYRMRNGGTPATFTGPTISQPDKTNLPNWYVLTLDEDTTIDAGNVTEEMLVRVSASGAAPAEFIVNLFDRLPSDIVKVNGEDTGVIIGTAQTGTLSTTQATSNLTGYDASQLVGRRIIVLDGPAEGEAKSISGYSDTGGLITFDAMTTAMQNGNKFKIV